MLSRLKNNRHAHRGGAIENVNAPLALRLIPLAEELDNPDLVDRLLKHAESSAVDDLESG